MSACVADHAHRRWLVVSRPATRCCRPCIRPMRHLLVMDADPDEGFIRGKVKGGPRAVEVMAVCSSSGSHRGASVVRPNRSAPRSGKFLSAKDLDGMYFRRA